MHGMLQSAVSAHFVLPLARGWVHPVSYVLMSHVSCDRHRLTVVCLSLRGAAGLRCNLYSDCACDRHCAARRRVERQLIITVFSTGLMRNRGTTCCRRQCATARQCRDSCVNCVNYSD